MGEALPGLQIRGKKNKQTNPEMMLPVEVKLGSSCAPGGLLSVQQTNSLLYSNGS